jgi:two-component system NtrC family sensor kinase
VTIHTNLEQSLPYVRVSEAELQQVFLNLINNSLDAMEKTGGAVNISTRTEQGSFGREIVIDVGDDGPGIPKANLTRIFDPFFTTKPVGKGTGLGLSICYGIIKKLGGDIQVQSVMGKGTKFSIRIPVRDANENNSRADGV